MPAHNLRIDSGQNAQPRQRRAPPPPPPPSVIALLRIATKATWVCWLVFPDKRACARMVGGLSAPRVGTKGAGRTITCWGGGGGRPIRAKRARSRRLALALPRHERRARCPGNAPERKIAAPDPWLPPTRRCVALADSSLWLPPQRHQPCIAGAQAAVPGRNSNRTRPAGHGNAAVDGVFRHRPDDTCQARHRKAPAHRDVGPTAQRRRLPGRGPVVSHWRGRKTKKGKRPSVLGTPGTGDGGGVCGRVHSSTTRTRTCRGLLRRPFLSGLRLACTTRGRRVWVRFLVCNVQLHVVLCRAA